MQLTLQVKQKLLICFSVGAVSDDSSNCGRIPLAWVVALTGNYMYFFRTGKTIYNKA